MGGESAAEADGGASSHLAAGSSIPPGPSGPAGPASWKSSPRREWLLILGLAAIAIAVRALIWHRTAAMMNDGATFLRIAQRFASGDWQAGFSHAYHPLYPLAVAAFKPFFAGWDSAGAAVSIVSGGLAVAFLYDFLRRAFGFTPAWVGALLLAVHPYAAPYSSDVQSEGLYYALFLGGVTSAWRVLERPRFGAAVAAGCLSGLAFLTRPEGLGPMLVCGAVLLGLWARRRLAFRPMALAGAGLTLGASLIAGPYMAAISVDDDGLRLTRKKNVSVIVTMRGGNRTLAAERRYDAEGETRPWVAARLELGGKAIRRLFVSVKRSFRLDHALIAGLGIWATGGPAGLRAAFFAVLLGLYGLVLIGLQLDVGYVSKRHVLPPLLPALGYVALGLPVLGRMVLLVPRSLAGRGPAAGRTALIAGLTLLLTGSTIMAVRPQRRDRVAIRAAAEWLAENADASRVATLRKRDAWYAGGRWVELPHPTRENLEGWIEYLSDQKVRYAIVDERARKRYPGIEAGALDDRIRVLHRTAAEGRAAVVLEIKGAN